MNEFWCGTCDTVEQEVSEFRSEGETWIELTCGHVWTLKSLEVAP